MAEKSFIKALGDVELFSDLPNDALGRLANEMREYRYADGDVIVKQGEGGQLGRMFVVLDGTAQADVDGTIVGTYSVGDEFGEMSLLDGSPRSATVTATSDVLLAGLASWHLRSVVIEEPTIAMHLIEVLARRLRAANADLTHD
jgi:CRP/FNR family transcriptional regulator, cyclic AMP receptor protein